jgi:hypothetical protein
MKSFFMVLVSKLFTFRYECLCVGQPNESRFVLRTEDKYSSVLPRSVLLEVSWKCDVFKDWLSVAYYHLGSQWRIVLSRKCDVFKDWFSVANYQFGSQGQTVIPFLFCVLEEV